MQPFCLQLKASCIQLFACNCSFAYRGSFVAYNWSVVSLQIKLYFDSFDDVCLSTYKDCKRTSSPVSKKVPTAFKELTQKRIGKRGRK